MDLYPLSSNLETAYENNKKKYVLPEPTSKKGRFMTLPYLLHSYYLGELQEYLDRDVIGSVCYYLALLEAEVSIEVLNFHAEHCIIRVASFWEHLFQLLNTYLEINFFPSKKLYREINGIWKASGLIRMKKEISNITGNGKIHKKVKTFLKSQNFVKSVKKAFFVDKYLRPLVNLANSKETNKLNELRDLIIHQKYLSQRTYPQFVSENVQVFQLVPRNEVKHNNLGRLLDICLKNLYLGMGYARDLMNEDIPLLRKGPIIKEHSLITVSCSCSPDKVQGIPKYFFDIQQSSPKTIKSVFCHYCLSDNISIIDENYDVSEQTWEEKNSEHIKLLMKNVERKLQKITCK